MAESPVTFDWAAERGEKWRANLAGMEATLAGVDGPLIEALRLHAPESSVPLRIADVGCGGGGTTFAIARSAPEGSLVQGFDISPALIEAARARLDDRGSVSFHLADIVTAPEPSIPFDRLTSRFGTMFYDDPGTAFANLARWLAPGGRFAFAVWGPPAENPWAAVLREITMEFIPDLPAPEPEAPGPFRYAEVGTLATLLKRSGFAQIEAEKWSGQLPIGGGLSAREAARFALRSFSFGELLAKAGGSTFDSAIRRLSERYLEFQDEIVRMDASVHIVRGVRAGRSAASAPADPRRPCRQIRGVRAGRSAASTPADHISLEIAGIPRVTRSNSSETRTPPGLRGVGRGA